MAGIEEVPKVTDQVEATLTHQGDDATQHEYKGGHWTGTEYAETVTYVEGTEPANRPEDGADTDAWVDYCVSLGASRESITQETTHWSDREQEFVTAPALDNQQLVELANNLGG